MSGQSVDSENGKLLSWETPELQLLMFHETASGGGPSSDAQNQAAPLGGVGSS